MTVFVIGAGKRENSLVYKKAQKRRTTGKPPAGQASRLAWHAFTAHNRFNVMQRDTFQIHPFVEEDFPELVGIFNLARKSAGCYPPEVRSPESFEKEIEGEVILVAKEDSRIVGFVSVWETENFLHHLYVTPEYQGRGIGSNLITVCKEKFGLPISLKCDRCNNKAREFYKRNGWITKREGVGEYGTWDHMFLEKA